MYFISIFLKLFYEISMRLIYEGQKGLLIEGANLAALPYLRPTD